MAEAPAGRSYLIAATPRTGSWLLCDCLLQTGRAGRPAEYGTEQDEATWRTVYGCASHAAYLARLPELLATPNGVRGLKAMPWQFEALVADAGRHTGLGRDPARTLRAFLGDFVVIRLHREDRIRQAVSWVRAQRTARWFRLAGSAPVAGGEGDYCRADIERALALVDDMERSWAASLRTLPVEVLRLSYEELDRDLLAALGGVAAFLHLAGPLGEIRPRLRRLSDGVSDEWTRRARVDLGA